MMNIPTCSNPSFIDLVTFMNDHERDKKFHNSSMASSF